MIYANDTNIKDPLNQDLRLNFTETQTKTSFSLLESNTKRLLALLHSSHTYHTYLKGRVLSFKATTSNDRVLWVYTPSGHRTRKQLTSRRFFEKRFFRWENEKKKWHLKTSIVLWIKWKGIVVIKHKENRNVFPIMPYQNSLWIMGSRIYGEGKPSCLWAHLLWTIF